MPNKTIETMTPEQIEEFITHHLPVKNLEKAKYGEVFTPSALIKKMFDKFPATSWSNPDLKWLDPCCGTGNFLIHVYQRLMLGLQKWEPNEDKRSAHIIENMLYMVELNKKNYDICRQLFGPKANIVCSDFLLDKQFFGDNMTGDAFNYIVGNPPFQEDNTVNGSGGKSKLYERIFSKAMTLLKDNGYLAFLVPDNMLSGNGNVAYNTLIQNNVKFVSFNKEIQSFFPGIQQYICYFLLQKKNTKGFTQIENTDGHTFNTQLLDRSVNPVRNWTPYVEKLLKQYITNVKNNAVYNRGKQLSLYNGTKYSVIYTSSKRLRTNKIELAPGINIKKAVVFAISPKLEFEMDYTGKYGVGPNTFYIPFNSVTQGRRLEAFLKSHHYSVLALACKTSRQFLKIGFVEHLNLEKIMGTEMNKNMNSQTRNLTQGTKKQGTRKQAKTMKKKPNK
jgi:SAM-dependent methyltransferase